MLRGDVRRSCVPTEKSEVSGFADSNESAVHSKKRVTRSNGVLDARLCERTVKGQHEDKSYGKHVRVTRSATKLWQKTCGYVVSNVQESREVGADAPEQNLMKPPIKPPPYHVQRNIFSGVLTRKQRKALGRDSIQSEVRTAPKELRISTGGRCVTLENLANTSDYGTASEGSRNCSAANDFSPVSSVESCHCESITGITELDSGSSSVGSMTGQEQDFEELDSKPTDLSCAAWDSDGNDCETQNKVEWDSEAEQRYYRHLRESVEVTLLRSGQVTAIIPKINSSGYKGEFRINVKSGESSNFYRHGLSRSMRVHHVSPVVSVEPHGVHFHESYPALLSIPLSIEPQDEKWLVCLCSNTPDGELPCWKRLPQKDYSYSNGYLVITAGHFSLFTVIMEEPYPEVMRHIRSRRGGRLYLEEVPGVEVVFPQGCLEHDLDAYLRILFDSEPHMLTTGEHHAYALASPVIMLGPHGHQFDQNRQPVYIRLPVPDYHEIVQHFGPHVRLSVWQSSTREGEPMVWNRLDVPLKGPYNVSVRGMNIPVVSFPVHHFSFFKILWDVLSTTLYEAKMGMSYFYPYISFSMMCQAFMEESGTNNRFGLEVICYRSDHRLPETTNYRHRVGSSLKPKMVRPGRILVRLRSQMFEADVEAGEDADMVKEEPDFRGRDFEKQYACRFKPDANVERGPFGKVIVERFVSAAAKDPLFEFNLNKTGLEAETVPPVGCERWTVFAMKELAGSLQITDGNNWKKFAQHIGFTKNEIKNKLQYADDPFLMMMNMYNGRGGTPEEFVQALYAVSRDLRINGGNTGSEGSGSNRSSGSKNSDGHASSSQDSGGGVKRRLWNFRPFAKALDSDSDEDTPTKGQKRPLNSSDKKSPGVSDSKRRKFSDISETISSSGDDAKDIKSSSTVDHRKNPRKLSDKDLWQISSKIVRKDWRNLGRTLGIEEQVLLNLEHAHHSIGFRECAYQMLLEWKGRKPRSCTFGELYSALMHEDMVSVAKHMVKTVTTREESDDSSS
ncbi:uncharacterized protein LOC124595385 [Schistocerca americana]|uniref:uncharacterized protein LOC124595385 n=1 Tax=Schistocerca americana TaxID=7009 RepID=UPI001F4F4ADB|nr:uncharacterized protein LOC124595385 [Schistocerca americana]